MIPHLPALMFMQVLLTIQTAILVILLLWWIVSAAKMNRWTKALFMGLGVFFQSLMVINALRILNELLNLQK